MELAKIMTETYTEEDYYNLPENIRAELIDGQFYDMASPVRTHQKILGELYAAIHSYIRSHSGSCEVYPAPFAVKLFACKFIERGNLFRSNLPRKIHLRFHISPSVLLFNLRAHLRRTRLARFYYTILRRECKR